MVNCSVMTIAIDTNCSIIAVNYTKLMLMRKHCLVVAYVPLEIVQLKDKINIIIWNNVTFHSS